MKTIPPEEPLLTAMGQFILHINNLQTFYGTTTDALEIGKDHVEQKILKATKEGIAKPEIQEIIGAEKCNSVLQNEPFLNFFMKSFAYRSVRLSKQMVGSSALVFAHTILENCSQNVATFHSRLFHQIGIHSLMIGKLKFASCELRIHKRSYIKKH